VPETAQQQRRRQCETDTTKRDERRRDAKVVKGTNEQSDAERERA
jgi:hypothetical protein